MKLHIENFRAIPGVTAVSGAASVKTAERKANLQFSVARVTRDGRRAFLLDTDIDENGNLLLHTFDLIKHAFTGGTHPVDVHECLCTAFPSTDLGYRPRAHGPAAGASGAGARGARDRRAGGTDRTRRARTAAPPRGGAQTLARSRGRCPGRCKDPGQSM